MADENLLHELTHGATSRLDPEFRSSGGSLDLGDFTQPFPRNDVDLRPLHVVLDEAMNRFSRGDSAKSDAWLGPRLHYVLRLRRHEAARRGAWLYLAIASRPDYVVWRFGDEQKPDEPVGIERFAGPDYKHAFARLWWMAELFRNGNDYRPAELALSNQDITNYLFRSDIAHHRPTALGAISVMFPSEGDPRTGRAANALAKAINATATTLQFDGIVLDSGPDEAAVKEWIEMAPDVDPGASFDVLPGGPEDPAVDAAEVAQMADLLDVLLQEAPIRGAISEEAANASPAEQPVEAGVG